MKRRLIVTAALTVLIGSAVSIRLASASPEPFSPGICREAEEAVRSLARITRHDDVEAVSAADRAELRRVQDRLVTLGPAATADVRKPMADLVLTLGHLRLRLDSRTAEPRYVRDVERARVRLEKTCVVA